MLAMELDWQSPPISAIHTQPEWQTTHDSAGLSAIPASSSAFATRRRSVVANAPPPGPPPTQPIPNVPALPSHYAAYDRDAYDYQNEARTYVQPYARPAASAGLAAVVGYSQSRLAGSSTGPSPPVSASTSPDNLSDSPPRSILRPISSKQTTTTREMPQDRQLLAAPEPQQMATRPSPRRALTRALELAREAVRLDATNNDPYGAVVAYGQSVALLSEVMQRVMSGEDSTEGHRRQNGRRRSVVAQEEEVRRLKSIHDTYADRMNILSVIYSIPLPNSPSSNYAASSISQSTESTSRSSPTSISPTSDASDPYHHFQIPSHPSSLDDHGYSSEGTRTDPGSEDELHTADAIGTALTTSTIFPLAGRVATSAANPPMHPYANLPPPSPTNTTTNPPIRASLTPSARHLRPRAASNLPPPAPPPTTLPPPAPGPIPSDPPPEPPSSLLKAPDAGRVRGNSVSHSRNNSSSRLSALREEKAEEFVSQDHERPSSRPRSRNAPYPMQNDLAREHHPLPPLPPSSPDLAATPRVSTSGHGTTSEPPSPLVATQYTTPRSRGDSTFSVRSETTSANKPSLIHQSTAMGTISQRRSKTSAPPSTTSSSPTDSVASIPSVSSRLTASTLPATTVSSLGLGGRNRASSQPGRRPSMAAGSSYFPPGVTAAPSTAPTARKPSIPSRLNPNIPPQISINTALMSPPLGPTLLTPLVPPPPIPHHNIPTAPLSPLPSLAPPDPLRKPYHMMTLLRQTMTSKTGGYVTRRLHVPQEVWSQGGARLTNIPEKIRVVEVLCSALSDLQHWSAEYFGAGNVSSGMALGIGSIGRAEGDAWAAKLEDFASVCDGVVNNFGKKLGVGEGFVTKRNGGVREWGGKLTRQFDKITNGKNLDSPALYVQGLSKLFLQAQILDEHTKAATSTPPAPLYTCFPPDVRQGLEFKLRHASEFFAKVILTFVIGDMALLLDKYVKKCEKWLAE